MGIATREPDRDLVMFADFKVVFILILVIGTIVSLNMFGSESEGRASADIQQETLAGEQEATEHEDSANEANNSQLAEDERLSVGDSVEIRDIRVTLNEVRVLPTTEFDEPIESLDNLFVATDLTFENTSEETVVVSRLLELILKSEDGYSAFQTVHSQQRKLARGEIAPEQKTSGEIVYEVPPEAEDLQLDYRHLAAGETHTWYIGDANNLTGSAEGIAEAVGGESVVDEFVETVEDYYEAVDREDWSYTYKNLDSQTRSMFTEGEWHLKNHYLAAEGLEVSYIDVQVNGSASDPMVSVTVHRTLKNGTSITRDTYFVWEDGTWKRRFTQEDIGIFMPGTPYEEFVAVHRVVESSSAYSLHSPR